MAGHFSSESRINKKRQIDNTKDTNDIKNKLYTKRGRFDVTSGTVSTQPEIIKAKIDLAKVNLSHHKDIEYMFKDFEEQECPITHEDTKRLFAQLQEALEKYEDLKVKDLDEGLLFWQKVEDCANKEESTKEKVLAKEVLKALDEIEKDACNNPKTKEVILYFSEEEKTGETSGQRVMPILDNIAGQESSRRTDVTLQITETNATSDDGRSSERVILDKLRGPEKKTSLEKIQKGTNAIVNCIRGLSMNTDSTKMYKLLYNVESLHHYIDRNYSKSLSNYIKINDDQDAENAVKNIGILLGDIIRDRRMVQKPIKDLQKIFPENEGN